MLKENLVYTDIKGNQNIEVIEEIASKLVNEKIVKEEYREKLVEREKEYPTGIYTGGINVAIPHADYELVNESAIAVAVLKEPVAFKRMEAPEEDVKVSIVFMLAINEPHGHIDVLSKIGEILQNQELLKEIVDSESKQQIIKLLEEKL